MNPNRPNFDDPPIIITTEGFPGVKAKNDLSAPQKVANNVLTDIENLWRYNEDEQRMMEQAREAPHKQ